MEVVAYSPCCPCFTVLMMSTSLILADHLALAPVLLLVHFSFENKKMSYVSGLSIVQYFGYLLMKYSLSPETGLALLQSLWSEAAGRLLRLAHCSFWELRSLLTLTQAQLSPRHFPALLLMTGSSADCAWDTPGLSSLFFWSIQIHPSAKTSGFASSQIVCEELCTSARSAAVYCSRFLQAAQEVWWDFWHWASSPFQFICPVVPTRVWWYSCPENTIPTAAKLQSSQYLCDSNFCQQVLLGSPSHCKGKDMCNAIKLSSACRQGLRSFCGCAVTHISWDADVF